VDAIRFSDAEQNEEIEGRINAFVGSWLDSAPESWGDDFDINTFALIF
jgi:hypothetical protein